MAMLGYARVSTTEQDPGPQVEQLHAAGCERVWVESASGYRDDRPELAALLDYARDGDVIVIWRLDRLARSTQHLLSLSADLDKRGVGLKSLSDPIDTTTATGKLIYTLLAAIAEFEGNLRRERQEIAWSAGKPKGRPGSLTGEQRTLAARLRGEGRSLAEIGRAVGAPKTTIHRHLTALIAAIRGRQLPLGLLAFVVLAGFGTLSMVAVAAGATSPLLLPGLVAAALTLLILQGCAASPPAPVRRGARLVVA
jgi:DNA invertase Pin-like site-specific DNA recombinase